MLTTYEHNPFHRGTVLSELVLSALSSPRSARGAGRVTGAPISAPWVSLLWSQDPRFLTILCPPQIGLWSLPVRSKVWQPELNPTFQLSPPSSSIYSAKDAAWDHIRLGAAILTWDYIEPSAKTFFTKNLFILHPSPFHFTSGSLVYHFVCFRCFRTLVCI